MNYISNIDTICVLVDIENYMENTKNILEYLEQEKEKAKLYVQNNALYKHLITINDMSFSLSINGKKGYAYLLKNNGFEVDIAQYKSKLKNFMPIQVRISSEYLWAYGLSYSWSIIYNWLVETFGNIINEKVFRLDLCCHVSDIDFIKDYEISYKGDFKKRQTFYTGTKINSITFGSRKCKNIYCRIYNKSLEIQEMKHKIWFYEIWKNNNMNIKNVWNIEFEVKSDFLRKFNINTIEDILVHLQDLWNFCTKKWLIKVDRINERIDRCPICSEWLEVQNTYNSFNSVGLIKREKQIETDANVLIPSIVGNITSYSARRGSTDIDKALSFLSIDMKKYLYNKSSSFESEVTNKMAFIHDSEVKQNE